MPGQQTKSKIKISDIHPDVIQDTKIKLTKKFRAKISLDEISESLTFVSNLNAYYQFNSNQNSLYSFLEITTNCNIIDMNKNNKSEAFKETLGHIQRVQYR